MGTEQEIFDSGVSDEEEVATALAPEAASDEAEPAEHAAQEPPAEQKPEAAQDAAPQQEPAPQPQHHVPLTEFLTARERAQAAERERDQFRQRYEALERERRAQEEAAKQQKPQPPDQFADPDGYTQFMLQQQQALEQSIWQKIENAQTQEAIFRTRQTHGELFDKAWTEFNQAAAQNPALAQVWQQLPPWQRGEEVIGWYKQQQTLREIGSDPAAYRTKLQQELLSDPAFLAQAVEKLKAGQGPAQNARPQTVTRLPPSLNRVTSAAPAHGADDGDDSEDAIFAAGRPARRR